MPVMNEQVRKARAERLLQLREEGMSPVAAWRVVDSDSKATDSSAAERTRSEIRRYRERYCVVDAPGESDGLEGGEAGGPNGAALNGAAAEVAEDVAAKPAKRCAGVAGGPCGKEISGRSPRCDDCRKEHGRLRKQRNNRNDHRRHGEERKELGIKKLQEEEERHREEERRRLQDEEAKRQAAALEAEREAELKRIEAELEAARATRRAEEERLSKMIRSVEFVPGEPLAETLERCGEVGDVRTG